MSLASMGGEAPCPAAVPLVEWPSGRGLVGLFEGFEERGVLGNDMILERGRQQQHQQQQQKINK